MISGSSLTPGRKALNYAGQFAVSSGGVGIIASDIRTNAVTAALCNGMLAHADETDDSNQYSLTHPGCAVVPAALAMAECVDATGIEFLRGVVAGYEVCAKVGIALGADTYVETGRSCHAVSGCMGAAAAAAHIARLEPARVAMVLAYASHSASGLGTLFRDPDHEEKAYAFAGLPARGGLESVMMIKSGMTAGSDPFDGEPSFFTANNAKGNSTDVASALGKPMEITRTNIKRWSVGSPAQAIMDALHSISADHTFETADVERIEIFLSPASARVVDAKGMRDINVQYLSALMILDRTLTFASLHDDSRSNDLQLLELISKVHLLSDQDLVDTSNKKLRQGAAAVFLRDGRRLFRHVSTVRGTADNPMNADEVAYKACDLISRVFDSQRTERLLSALMHLDHAGTVDGIVSLACRR
jgi:2-methylcitrate dehydratase PrpD